MKNKILIFFFFFAILFTSCSDEPIQLGKTPNALFEATKASSGTTIDHIQKDEQKRTPAHVTHVVDGDTITVVLENHEKKTIRLIGVNTPETVHPSKPVECYGREASTFLKQLLNDQDVLLAVDPSQQNTDKYGRLLRYVYLHEKELVNETIIKEGFGHEATYNGKYLFQKDFKEAQKTAQNKMKGLWDPKRCPQVP